MRIRILFLLFLFVSCSEKLEIIDPQISYPEGPVWTKNGLYYVSYPSDKIFRFHEGKIHLFWEAPPGKPFTRCGPAGLIQKDEGDFFVSCYDTNKIIQISEDGNTLGEIVKTDAGKFFTGPNDFAKNSKGEIFFSASGIFDDSKKPSGKIYRIEKNITVKDISPNEPLSYPNGIAFSTDEKKIIVNEHLKNRIVTMNILSSGMLSEPKQFIDLKNFSPKTKSLKTGPDGLKLGPISKNLYVCHYGGSQILIFTQEGNFIKKIPMPMPFVTNITFRENTEVEMFVTAELNANSENFQYSGKVYRIILK